MNDIERDKYNETYRNYLLVFSIVFIIINLVVAYLIKESMFSSATETAADIYDGSYESKIAVKEVLDVGSLLSYFINTFKFTSFGVLLIFIYNVYSKHWVSYSLFAIGGVVFASILLSGANSGVLELDSFFFYLNRVLLYISLPCFIYPLHCYAKENSEIAVNVYRGHHPSI